MNKQPFFQSASIVDYRALKCLEIPRLARVNIIGGMNGAGKTSLLEALFMLLNLGDSFKLQRPLNGRGLIGNVDLTRRLLFHGNSSHLKISCSTRIGSLALEARFEFQPTLGLIPTPTPVSAQQTKAAPTPETGSQISQPAAMGLTVTTGLNGDEEITRYVDAPQPGNPFAVTANRQRALNVSFPQALLISRAGVQNPYEQAAWYTSLIQKGQKAQLLILAQAVLPAIEDIILLQFGGVPQVCGVMKGASTHLPISFLGEGAGIAIGIGLAMLDLSEGVLLLDEFDTALHHSVLEQVWTLFGQFARASNSQIVAVTHSRDCIEAAARAFGGTAYESDLQYIRLDKLEGEIKTTPYSAQDLADAIEGTWEMR